MEIRSPKSDLEWEDYYNLRYRILRQPLGQPVGSEKNDGDLTGHHLALYNNDQLVAITRLDQAEPQVSQVRFVAVESGNSGKGYGRKIMEEAERISKENGNAKMILQARDVAVDFYLNLDYKMIRKTHLLFDQVQHYLMEKEYC